MNAGEPGDEQHRRFVAVLRRRGGQHLAPDRRGRVRPVRGLDRVAADGPEPRVRDELVRSREHGDGVELHGADPAQHPGHPAALCPGPEESLRVKGDPPHLVSGELKVFPGWRPGLMQNGSGLLSHANDSNWRVGHSSGHTARSRT